MQTAIPYVHMRGGTSKGPYFRRQDLPEDLDQLADVLVAVLGSGHALNIDGIGASAAVTTKVAMLSLSDDPWADIDYFFAQVSVIDRKVDFKPTCGNILSGVAQAAVELGLIQPTADETTVKIRAVNTGAQVVSVIQTPDGRVTYDGDARIDGVPGSAAQTQLTFEGVVGSATGAFLPTGNLQDEIDGLVVTCMDVAMPVVIARATDLGITGYESAAELDDNRSFFQHVESVRQKAGALMGIEDVANSVTPKFGVIAPAREGGSITARYLMPHNTHTSMAVTGAQCIAACALTPGTVADSLWQPPTTSPAVITLEHPSGSLDVLVTFSVDGGFKFQAAGLMRTARKLADGHVYVPTSVWAG